MVGFFQPFESFDGRLFELIHDRLRNPVFDVLMPILSHPFHHWQVVAGIIWLALLLFGRRHWRLSLLFIAVAIAVSDSVSSHVLKELFRRPRPLGGETFSFPSSHAANSFGVATYLFLWNRKLWPLFVLGFLVGYSRVYVGSHYPLDVLGGIMVGIGSGLVTFFLQKTAANRMPPRFLRLFPPAKRTSCPLQPTPDP